MFQHFSSIRELKAFFKSSFFENSALGFAVGSVRFRNEYGAISTPSLVPNPTYRILNQSLSLGRCVCQFAYVNCSQPPSICTKAISFYSKKKGHRNSHN